MDLSFTEDELTFRDKVRAFFRSAVPTEIREKLIAGRHLTKSEIVRWTQILAEKGWSVPEWPVEYGGTGWNLVKQYIFTEEMSQTPASAPRSFGVNLVGPGHLHRRH